MRTLYALLLIFTASSCVNNPENIKKKLPTPLVEEVIERDFSVIESVGTYYIKEDHFTLKIKPNKEYDKVRVYSDKRCTGDFKTFDSKELESGAKYSVKPNSVTSINVVFDGIDGHDISSKCEEVAIIHHDNIPPKEIPTANEKLNELNNKPSQNNSITLNTKDFVIPNDSERMYIYSDSEGKEVVAIIDKNKPEIESVSFNILENDATEIYMAYEDRATNLGIIHGPISTLIHDNIPPVLTLEKNKTIFAPGEIFSGECSGVETVSIHSPIIQDVDCLNGKYEFIIPEVTGDFLITIDAYDAAENYTKVETQALIDGTPPEKLITFEPLQILDGLGTNKNPITLDLSSYTRPNDVYTVEIFDASSNLLGKIEDEDFKNGSYNLTIAENKTTDFYLVAIDRAHNRSEKSNKMASYTHDNIAPNLTASIEPKVLNNAIINGTCEYSVSLYGSFQGYGDCINGSFAISIGIQPDGNKKIFVSSSDPIGNITKKELNFVVDNTAPYAGVMNWDLNTKFRTAELNFNLTQYDIYFDNDTVKLELCSDSSCNNINETVTHDAYKSSGISIALAENSITEFYLRATDDLGNNSINGPYFLENDTSVPNAPTLNEYTISLATRIVTEMSVNIGGSSSEDTMMIDVYKKDDLNFPVMGYDKMEWDNGTFNLMVDTNISTEYVAFAVNDVGTKSATGVSFKVNHAYHPMFDMNFSEIAIDLGSYINKTGLAMSFNVQNVSQEMTTGLKVGGMLNLSPMLSEKIDRVESTCLGKEIEPEEFCKFDVYVKDGPEGDYQDIIELDFAGMLMAFQISYKIVNPIIAESSYTDYNLDALRKVNSKVHNNSEVKSLIIDPVMGSLCPITEIPVPCVDSQHKAQTILSDEFFVYFPHDNIFIYDKDNLNVVDVINNTSYPMSTSNALSIQKNYMNSIFIEGENEVYTFNKNSIDPFMIDFHTKSATDKYDGLSVGSDFMIGDDYIASNSVLLDTGINLNFSDIHNQLGKPYYTGSKVHSVQKIDEDTVLIAGVAYGTEETTRTETVTQRDPVSGEFYCWSGCHGEYYASIYGAALWMVTYRGAGYAYFSAFNFDWVYMNIPSTQTQINVDGWTWHRGSERAAEVSNGVTSKYYAFYRTRTIQQEVTDYTEHTDVFLATYNLNTGETVKVDSVELAEKFSNTSVSKKLNRTNSIMNVVTTSSNYNYFVNAKDMTLSILPADFDNSSNSRAFMNDDYTVIKRGSSNKGRIHINNLTGDYATPGNSPCSSSSSEIVGIDNMNYYVLDSNSLCIFDLVNGTNYEFSLDNQNISQIYKDINNNLFAVVANSDNTSFKVVKIDLDIYFINVLADYSSGFSSSSVIIKNDKAFEFNKNIVEVNLQNEDGSGKTILIDLKVFSNAISNWYYYNIYNIVSNSIN